MKQTQSKQPSPLRYWIVGVIFVLLCTVFVVVLAVIQIRGSRDGDWGDDVITRTVTVAGLRGEIYDRNGKLLVGNATTYDLLFEYGAMPDTRREINDSLLSLLEALRKTGNEDT